MTAELTRLFERYRLLVRSADAAFQRMAREYDTAVRCERRCCDCCHAVFGLFLIEAAHLKQQFDRLGGQEMEAARLRCEQADRGLIRLEATLQQQVDDPHMQALALATQRIRCPLLDERGECVMYAARPITCRVYGIPTQIHGKSRVCAEARFNTGGRYPVFDLDGVYRTLFVLSREFIKGAGRGDPDKASLLISVSKALRTPLEDLLGEIFG